MERRPAFIIKPKTGFQYPVFDGYFDEFASALGDTFVPSRAMHYQGDLEIS
jgi:hypothetical protein